MKNMLKVFNMRKLVLDLHLFLVNSLKYRQCIKKLFCKQEYFETGLSNVLKKYGFIYVFEPCLFHGHYLLKVKATWN